MTKLIDAGDWGHSTFEVYLDLNGSFENKRHLATGVFCVCFDGDEKVILANFEPLGGHIEQGEFVEDALKREVLEEGGVVLEAWKYFGFYKVSQKHNASPEFKDMYPETAYLLFFIGKGKKVMEPYGSDVKSSQVLSVAHLLNSPKIKHKLLLEGVGLGINYFAL